MGSGLAHRLWGVCGFGRSDRGDGDGKDVTMKIKGGGGDAPEQFCAFWHYMQTFVEPFGIRITN